MAEEDGDGELWEVGSSVAMCMFSSQHLHQVKAKPTYLRNAAWSNVFLKLGSIQIATAPALPSWPGTWTP